MNNEQAQHDFTEQFQRNLDRVEARIECAAERSGRSRSQISLVAITKYLSSQQTRQVATAGCRQLGESRPQVLWEKHPALTDCEIEWHLVGHLQRNKVKRTLPLVHMIHSLDSWRLARAIEREAAATPTAVAVLLEANVSGESNKGGFHLSELEAALAEIKTWPHLQVQGLMCMGGLESDAAELRRQFALLRETRDRLQAASDLPLPHLSMGMSNDFEIAIEEGATIVRIGSALYDGAL